MLSFCVVVGTLLEAGRCARVESRQRPTDPLALSPSLTFRSDLIPQLPGS